MAAIMAVSTKDKICGEICDALGLKHVRKLDLHMAIGEIMTCEVEFYPEEDGIKQMIPLLGKFKLVLREPKNMLGEELGEE